GGPAGPPSDLPAGEGLAAALRGQYTELLTHDPGTRLGSDPEDLHQLRVATRRLRAFLRAGRPLVDRDWADALRDELVWLGGSLGPVRDLDVLIEHLRADVESLDDEDREAASTLLGELTKERRTARRRLLRALGSDRYLQLLDRVEAAAEPPLTAEADTGLRDIWQGEHKRLRKTVDAPPAAPRRRKTSCTRCASRSSGPGTRASWPGWAGMSRRRSGSRTCSASTRTRSSPRSGCAGSRPRCRTRRSRPDGWSTASAPGGPWRVRTGPAPGSGSRSRRRARDPTGA